MLKKGEFVYINPVFADTMHSSNFKKGEKLLITDIDFLGDTDCCEISFLSSEFVRLYARGKVSELEWIFAKNENFPIDFISNGITKIADAYKKYGALGKLEKLEEAFLNYCKEVGENVPY